MADSEEAGGSGDAFEVSVVVFTDNNSKLIVPRTHKVTMNSLSTVEHIKSILQLKTKILTPDQDLRCDGGEAIPSSDRKLIDCGINGGAEIACWNRKAVLNSQHLSHDEIKRLLEQAARFNYFDVVSKEKFNTMPETEKRRICKILSGMNLDRGQVEMLTIRSELYFIPQNQTKTQRHAFICYSTENRKGYEKEAVDLGEAFSKAGFQVTPLYELINFDDFKKWLKENSAKVKDICSLLFCCIMSHGYVGHVTGSDGSDGEINELLHTLQEGLHQSTPLVVLIQACQGFDPAASDPVGEPPNISDAALAGSDDCKSVSLRRAHTLVLMATIDGEAAMRGAYTGALAEQIQIADGITDINQMHYRAVEKLRGNDIKQTPMKASTLERGLVLPQANFKQHSAKEEKKTFWTWPVRASIACLVLIALAVAYMQTNPVVMDPKVKTGKMKQVQIQSNLDFKESLQTEPALDPDQRIKRAKREEGNSDPLKYGETDIPQATEENKVLITHQPDSTKVHVTQSKEYKKVENLKKKATRGLSKIGAIVKLFT